MTSIQKLFSIIVLTMVAQSVWASDTPLSGTFSNVRNKETSGYAESMRTPINLVVTIGSAGQQFFIQCFIGEQPGFGVVTVNKMPQQVTKIKAGSECPARNFEVQLGYEEAFLRFGNRFIYLPRGNIYVPIAP